MNNLLSMTLPTNTTLLDILSLRFDESHEVAL